MGWDFRHKPTGAWKALLHAPAYLFRAHLGFLFGERLILITHTGRTSGRRYRTPVEVVEHDRDTAEYIVCSGTGPHADWYENLAAHPADQVQVGNRHWRPVQRFLPQAEAAELCARYERRHPATASRLLESMGNRYDGTDAGRLAMMERMPMVGFGYSSGSGRFSPGHEPVR